MNIGQVKSEIKNLAFEESSSMQEYSEVVLEAINRAIQIIHSTVRPILGKVEIEQTELAFAEVVRYDMSEMAESFMGFSGKVTLETPEGRYRGGAAHRTEGKSILLLPGDTLGRYTVWYKRMPRKITAETKDNEELELDYDLHVLVPLLASYYVWLDDDERKATVYQNQYEDLRMQILSAGAERPMATMEGGLGF